MNNEITSPCPTGGRAPEWLRSQWLVQLGRLAVLVFAVLSVGLGSAAAQGSANMGPLSEFLFEGRDGEWQAAIRDGSFVLTNESDPASIFYLYTDAGVPGARRIRVEVKADWGQASRVGLLYGFEPETRVYYRLFIEEGGREVSLLRRGQAGLEPRASVSLQKGSGTPAWHELVIVERGSEIEWTVDGRTLGSLGNAELGEGFVGIIAMGTGSFAFRGFEVSEARAERGPSMRRDDGSAGPVERAAKASPESRTATPLSRQIAIMDQAFDMPIWRETVPASWEVFQQIATNLDRGGYATYLRDLYGPRGELIRDLGSTTHNSALGLSADAVIQQAMATVVEGLRMEQARSSPLLESLPLVAFKRRSQQADGFTLDTYEIPFEGRRGGEPVRGVLYLMNTPFPQLGNGGLMDLTLVVSRPEHFDRAVEVNRAVMQSRELSSDYLTHKQKHNYAASQRNQVAHQNRMAQLEANHAAHQTRMRDVYAASDARHEAWMNKNLRSPASGGDYGSHDAFVDQIHERTTFNDPYSGQETHREGQYDQWYTDGLGGYHGTDDPSFNPHSLPGNWEAIEPSRPQGW